MIRGQILLVHSESVPTLGVQVQFDRFVGAHPFLVKGKAGRHEPKLIIGGRRNKHWRRIGGNGRVLKLIPARIDRGYEGGPTHRQIMEGDSSGDSSASGESNNANAIGGNSPFRRMLPNVGDCR